MKGGPLVVLGDSMLDVDLLGHTSRLAPDAPVPVVDCRSERHRPGGAALAAALAAAQGAEVILITAIGADRHGDRLRQVLEPHAEVMALPVRGGTPCKVRVRADGQPMIRLDAGEGQCAPLPAGPAIARALASAGALLVSDYGRGVTGHAGLRQLITGLQPDVPVVWDPHPNGAVPVRGVRVVTPNAAEASQLAMTAETSPRLASRSPLTAAARDATALARRWQSAVAVTMGGLGAVLASSGQVPFLAPAEPARSGLADTCGAGDCFAATTALILRAGGLLTEAVLGAVSAASDFVAAGGAGTAAPGLDIPAPWPPSRARDTGGFTGTGGSPDPWHLVADVRARGGRVVATGGCFDVLHAGHVGLLRNARRLGDCLVVCLNSDQSVRQLKGPGRPLNPASDRAAVLGALDCVDAIVAFSEPTPAELLARLKPDVWVKGGDYAIGELAEADVVTGNGGEVVLLPYLTGHSTTRLLAAARDEAPATFRARSGAAR